MIIHLFNPEHDLALAHNGRHFTPPHAARELRMNLGYIPALWAADGDIVLVDDSDFAQKASRRLRSRMANVSFLTADEFRLRFNPQAVSLTPGECEVQVWGWDAAVCFQLSEAGVPQSLLPSDEQLTALRQLSHRRTAVGLLAALRQHQSLTDQTVGESCECRTMDDVQQIISRWRRVVLKAPWSSSGRGIKYVDGQLSRSQQGWCVNILREQGSVVAEVYYNKVKDFGMEFFSDGRGNVSYLGLSLFSTLNGAYTGNILATEADKEQMLAAYLPAELTHAVRIQLEALLSQTIGTAYRGPLGIDMMVVSQSSKEHAQSSDSKIQNSNFNAQSSKLNVQISKFLLHPCVELNLRRTMGHVALALSPSSLEPQRLMQITHGTNYELKLHKQLLNEV